MIKEINIGQIDILANMYSDKWHVPESGSKRHDSNIDLIESD